VGGTGIGALECWLVVTAGHILLRSSVKPYVIDETYDHKPQKS
jgi:hypothetical protein